IDLVTQPGKAEPIDVRVDRDRPARLDRKAQKSAALVGHLASFAERGAVKTLEIATIVAVYHTDVHPPIEREQHTGIVGESTVRAHGGLAEEVRAAVKQVHVDPGRGIAIAVELELVVRSYVALQIGIEAHMRGRGTDRESSVPVTQVRHTDMLLHRILLCKLIVRAVVTILLEGT